MSEQISEPRVSTWDDDLART